MASIQLCSPGGDQCWYILIFAYFSVFQFVRGTSIGNSAEHAVAVFEKIQSRGQYRMVFMCISRWEELMTVVTLVHNEMRFS
jgi:hypothetical protein